MKRLIGLAALLLLLASGCSSPAPNVTEPTEPVRTPDPAPVIEAAPCHGPVTAGPPSISIRFGEVAMPLPMTDCAIALPAGKVELTLLISNLQQPAPIQVTGAPAGEWKGVDYRLAFDLAPGEVRTLTLDVGGFSAKNPLTYTFTGTPAIEALFASGPSRQGPWTAVTGEMVPPEHTWLRIHYPRPIAAGSASIITDDSYAMLGNGLPGEWEGDHLQYVSIGDRKPVLFVLQGADTNGLQIFFLSGRELYRGAPPELVRMGPTTGEAKPIYRFEHVPSGLAYQNGQLSWSDRQGRRGLDLTSGIVTPVAEPSNRFMDGRSVNSPDGRLVAVLSYPDGEPGHPTEERSRPVTLAIGQRESDKTLVLLERGLTTWGSFSCSRGTPAMAWRPDGQTLAFLDAPAMDRLVLKEVDLSGAVRTIAEWRGQGVGIDQTEATLNWAPSGRLLVVGSRLVEVATGRTLAEQLPWETFWSPDSKHLLLHGPDHPFTNWGKVGLLTVASGERRDLGHGQGIGWTAQGEALFVRWAVSKEIPPPGKGCP